MNNKQLKKCPCGQIPKDLLIETGSSCKYSFACGDCCNEWSVEFRTTYTNDDSELEKLASIAWNSAARSET